MFTKDINMQFGSDKGPYIYIERGNQVLLHERECCKSLGQDKDISVNEVLKKDWLKHNLREYERCDHLNCLVKVK